MKTIFRKSVAVMLAALILLSAGVAGVTASAQSTGVVGTLKFETKLFRYDADSDEWIEADRVRKGENLKARIYIDTDYFTNSGELLFFYDKDFFTDAYARNEINAATVNPYYQQACGMEGQLVVYGEGHRAVQRLVDDGQISADFALEHTCVAMLYMFSINALNMKLNGDEWFIEFELTVREDTQAESGSFFALETTVQSPDNVYGFVNVPVGNEGGYIEDTEMLYSVYVDVETRDNPVKVKNYAMFEAGEGFFSGESNSKSVMLTGDIGSPIDLSEIPTPRRRSYKFAGWADASGNLVTPENAAEFGYKITRFTAVWEEYDEYFSLILDADGGSFGNGKDRVEYSLGEGEIMEITDTAEKQGYDFAGWADENGEPVSAIDMPAREVVITALWTPSENTPYTVTRYLMNTDGETYTADSQVLYGRTDGLVQAVPEELEGFTFDEASSETEAYVLPDGSAELSLYYSRNKYELVTYADGEVFGEDSRLYGELVEEPDAPRKDGYTFVKWTDKSTGGDVAFPLEMPAERVELEAVWEKVKEKYTVTFNTDGGSEIESLTVTEGEAFTLPTARKIGHSLAFWRDESGNMYAAGQQVVMPAMNKTFKAVWLVQSKSVTYIIGGDTVKFDVVPGNSIPLPDMSEYQNVELLCWLDENGNTVQIPDVMPENDLTFTAKLRYTYVDGKYGITASFESGCFAFEGSELTFAVEKITAETEFGGINYKGENYKQVAVYDIEFRHGTAAAEPEKGKTVQISIPVSAVYKDGAKLLVIHRFAGGGYKEISITKNGNVAVLNVEKSGEFEICIESGTTVKTAPSKTSYAYKESLDLSGLTLEVIDENGNKTVISDTGKMTVSGFDSKKIGKQTLTVEYGGTSAQFEVTVAYTWWQTLIRILLLGFLWY